MSDDKTLDQIIDHLYGEMSPHEEDSFLDRVESAPALGDEVAQYRKILTAYRLVPEGVAPAGAALRALAAARQEARAAAEAEIPAETPPQEATKSQPASVNLVTPPVLTVVPPLVQDGAVEAAGSERAVQESDALAASPEAALPELAQESPFYVDETAKTVTLTDAAAAEIERDACSAEQPAATRAAAVSQPDVVPGASEDPAKPEADSDLVEKESTAADFAGAALQTAADTALKNPVINLKMLSAAAAVAFCAGLYVLLSGSPEKKGAAVVTGEAKVGKKQLEIASDTMLKQSQNAELLAQPAAAGQSAPAAANSTNVAVGSDAVPSAGEREVASRAVALDEEVQIQEAEVHNFGDGDELANALPQEPKDEDAAVPAKPERANDWALARQPVVAAPVTPGAFVAPADPLEMKKVAENELAGTVPALERRPDASRSGTLPVKPSAPAVASAPAVPASAAAPAALPARSSSSPEKQVPTDKSVSSMPDRVASAPVVAAAPAARPSTSLAQPAKLDQQKGAAVEITADSAQPLLALKDAPAAAGTDGASERVGRDSKRSDEATTQKILKTPESKPKEDSHLFLRENAGITGNAAPSSAPMDTFGTGMTGQSAGVLKKDVEPLAPAEVGAAKAIPMRQRAVAEITPGPGAGLPASGEVNGKPADQPRPSGATSSEFADVLRAHESGTPVAATSSGVMAKPAPAAKVAAGVAAAGQPAAPDVAAVKKAESVAPRSYERRSGMRVEEKAEEARPAVPAQDVLIDVRLNGKESGTELLAIAKRLYDANAVMRCLFVVDEALDKQLVSSDQEEALTLKARVELKLHRFSDMEKTIQRLLPLNRVAADALTVLRTAGLSQSQRSAVFSRPTVSAPTPQAAAPAPVAESKTTVAPAAKAEAVQPVPAAENNSEKRWNPPSTDPYYRP